MTTIPPFMVGFSFTITSIAAAIPLYEILQGTAVTGVTLAAPLNYTPTGKVIAEISIQNDPTNGAGALVYLGDPTLTSANKGLSLGPGNIFTFRPARGSMCWASGIYINASATTTVVNVTVLYG